jgi:hypothetical protein
MVTTLPRGKARAAAIVRGGAVGVGAGVVVGVGGAVGVGEGVGPGVGVGVGATVGSTLGVAVGAAVGSAVGAGVGVSVGSAVGVGSGVGVSVGRGVGEGEDTGVGVGVAVGEGVAEGTGAAARFCASGLGSRRVSAELSLVSVALPSTPPGLRSRLLPVGGALPTAPSTNALVAEPHESESITWPPVTTRNTRLPPLVEKPPLLNRPSAAPA